MKPSRSETLNGDVAGRFAFTGWLVVSAFPLLLLNGAAHDVFTAHMLQHLIAMNLCAPLLALAIRKQRDPMALPMATALQLAGLWFWHVPASLALAHHSGPMNLLMQVSLFGTAVLFWQAIFSGDDRPVWSRIFALLITAKLFCLLGAVFVFSRRELYGGLGNPEAWGLTALEDQQLAGLIMVSSCALIYVAGAIALFSVWLFATKGDFSRMTSHAAPSPR